jgi:hypothetical protein
MLPEDWRDGFFLVKCVKSTIFGNRKKHQLVLFLFLTGTRRKDGTKQKSTVNINERKKDVKC